MHTALIAAAVTAGLVAAGAAANPGGQDQTPRAVQVRAACVEKVSSYPASSQPGISCGTSYTGYLGAPIDRR